MSEALAVQVVRDALQIPKGCTARQMRLARLVLERDPNSDQALMRMVMEAGYAYTTALATSRETLEAPGVSRAIAHIREQQSDSAPQLASKAMKRLGTRIDTMDDGPLIGAVKVLSEIAAASPPSDAVSSGIPRSWYKGQMRRWLAAMYWRGYRAAMRAAGPASRPGSSPMEVP